MRTQMYLWVDKKIRQICLSNWNGLLSTKTQWKTYGNFTPTDSTTMLSLLWPYLPITIEKRACERDQLIQWFLGRDLLDRVSISLTKLFFSEPNSVCLLSKIVLERSRWIITWPHMSRTQRSLRRILVAKGFKDEKIISSRSLWWNCGSTITTGGARKASMQRVTTRLLNRNVWSAITKATWIRR